MACGKRVITVLYMNPILLAFLKASHICLKYKMAKFDFRLQNGQSRCLQSGVNCQLLRKSHSTEWQQVTKRGTRNRLVAINQFKVQLMTRLMRFVIIGSPIYYYYFYYFSTADWFQVFKLSVINRTCTDICHSQPIIYIQLTI